jgi:hypothetical protein
MLQLVNDNFRLSKFINVNVGSANKVFFNKASDRIIVKSNSNNKLMMWALNSTTD